MSNGMESLGGVMRKTANSKTSKPDNKKEAFPETHKSVFSRAAEFAGVKSGGIKMKHASAMEAGTEVTQEERHHLISEAAYYRAEHRSFSPGYELEDWLNAEAEIERMLVKSSPENPIL
jgi:hypothetical protein